MAPRSNARLLMRAGWCSSSLTPTHWIGVEVKSTVSDAMPKDDRRGILQVVKYRAVLEAQAEVSGRVPRPKVDVMLALQGRLPQEYKRLASTLGVQVRENVNAGILDQSASPSSSKPVPDDDPESYLRNRCSYCEAILNEWHLCKTGGALIGEDGTPLPGATAIELVGTPFVLYDCGATYTDVQAVLDAAQKAD